MRIHASPSDPLLGGIHQQQWPKPGSQHAAETLNFAVWRPAVIVVDRPGRLSQRLRVQAQVYSTNGECPLLLHNLHLVSQLRQ